MIKALLVHELITKVLDMYAQVEKSKETKRRAVANSVGQKKSKVKEGFGFVDNRSETIAQRKMQSLTDNYSAQKRVPTQKIENNTGFPDNLKSGMENLSGYSLDEVKVHHNSDKPAQLQAHAYAQGTDIHLATGQEKHLPHEAWHVVQQKQGRVKPTMQLKEKVNVNDDQSLEKESDLMGQKASNAPLASNTLQSFRVSKASNNHLIQRQKIETFGGKFKTDEYKITTHDPKEGGNKGIGCKMNLEFHANSTVNCAKIGLTQTTTPTVKKEGVSHENYAAARGLARATEDTVEGVKVDKVRYLDRTKNNIHPVFGAQNPTEQPDLVPESFHSEQDKLGAHELNDIGKVTKNEPAVLLDEPGRDWKMDWTVIQSFETTALCLTGPMKGDYLGSIEWGYKYGPKDNGNVLPLKKISDGMPSEKFMEAVANWNKSKIPQEIGPDKDTVSLPEKERIGTNEALSISHRKFMLDNIEELSQTSVLNLLEDPIFSKHSRQLLIKRLYNLMSHNSLYFANSWLEAYHKRAKLKDILIKLSTEYAESGWEPQEWSFDESVGNIINKNEDVTANDLVKLLDSEKDVPVFFCLNPEFKESTSIKKNQHFFVPFKLLKQAAKEL